MPTDDPALAALKVKYADVPGGAPPGKPPDLLDRGWIQHSTAGHAAAAVFARKPD